MQKEAAWLLSQLSELVAKNVVDQPTSERLRAHYGAAAAMPGFGWGVVLLAGGGAALIALGIILIFAHNWEDWTPGVRVVLSLLPLVAGQVAIAFGIGRGRIWLEAAGAFTAIAVGASIALIAQTYQMGGDLPRFLLIWLLLALPLVYLLDSSFVAAICWLLTLGWVVAGADSGGWFRDDGLSDALRLPAFLLLACLPMPHLLRHIRADRAAPRVAWLLRIVVVVVGLGIYAAAIGSHDQGLMIVYAGLCGVAALTGARYFTGVHGLWGNPLLGAGRMGVYIVILAATVGDLLRRASLPEATLIPLALALGGAAIWLALSQYRGGEGLLGLAMGLLAPLLTVAVALADSHSAIALILTHAFVLALAAALIQTGLRDARLGLANQGATLVAIVVLIRFFDSDLSYVVRGVGFIVTGVSFVSAVIWLRRRVREAGP